MTFHPYKIHLRHELLPNDLTRRRNFCNWFLQNSIGFEDKLLIGDEAEFHLNGRVNNHNVRDTMLLGIRVLNLILILEFSKKKSQFGWKVGRKVARRHYSGSITSRDVIRLQPVTCHLFQFSFVFDCESTSVRHTRHFRHSITIQKS